MNELLNLALLQRHLVPNKPETNLAAFGTLMESLPDNTNVIVLPECFTTGMITSGGLHVEPHLGPSVAWMHQQAAMRNALVCGTLAVADAGGTFNRFYFAYPTGETLWYDKRHLFAYAGENRTFTAGHERKVFTYLGWRICPQVCYDIRFPVWNRNLDDYDLLLYSASFPAARDYSWRTLLAARAIENQCYTAGCNRVGTDEEGISYRGSSMVLSPSGRILGQISANVSGVILSQCSLGHLAKHRAKYPFLEDADGFTLSSPGVK